MRVASLFFALGVLASSLAAGSPEIQFDMPQLPNGGYQAESVPFPTLLNRESLRMELARGFCGWGCPSYRIEIHGDGSVLFDGDELVVLAGPHRTNISQASVDRLFEMFRKARFFSALDRYIAPISDSRTLTVSISFDGHRKTVEDYEGEMIGMPTEITAIENRIDKLVKPERWIKGSPHAFADLLAESWDFRAEDDAHEKLLAGVAGSGDFAMLGALLDAGMRPRGRYGCEAALRVRNGALLERLLHLGAPVQWRPASGGGYSCNLLTLAANDGDPKLLGQLLDHKPDVNLVDGNGQTALMYIAYEARRTNAHKGADVAACAKLLIEAGTALEIRDRVSKTTALMMSYDGKVTQVLLNAGADPYARDEEGRTALDWANMWHSPSVPVLKHWMEAHPQSR